MNKYTIFIILSILFVSSCSLKAVYQKNSFILQPTVHYKAKHKRSEVIEIAPQRCDARFDSNLFYYRKNNYEFMPYATINWIASPCSMIRSDIINSIEQSGIFKIAIDRSSFEAYQYRLLFSIIDLEPVFAKRTNFIVVKIRFFLFNAKNNFIGSYLFYERENIKDIRVQNIVIKMNNIVGNAIFDAMRWLDEHVK